MDINRRQGYGSNDHLQFCPQRKYETLLDFFFKYKIKKKKNKQPHLLEENYFLGLILALQIIKRRGAPNNHMMVI